MEKRQFVLSAIVLIGLIGATTLFGISFGSNGMHVHTAYTIPKGSIYAGGHSSAFFKDEIFNANQDVSSAVTYWDVQGRVGLLYGFNSFVEFSGSQIFYQDTNTGDVSYNIPDDLWLRAKFGSIGRKKSSVRLGAQLDLRLPAGDVDNIPLEAYSADRIGLGVMGLFSIISDPLFPSTGVNINANLGVFNHNDAGLTMTNNPQDNITSEKSTKELLYGASVSRMLQEFGFFAEVYGNYFLEEPPITAYTRENSLYLTPGIIHTPNSWLSLNVALDILLLGDEDKTSYLGQNGSVLDKPWEKVPNLPSWRINVGATITIKSGETKLAARQRGAIIESVIAPNTSETQEALFDELARERNTTESAEVELERIRGERERMEGLLERLRNILEKPAGTTATESTEENSETSPDL
jgi:hypothetical protein